MGVPNVESPPTIREELTRKAFEQIELMAVKLDRGEITEAQFDTGIRAVWGCVSGLVDEWLVETISEIKDRDDPSFYDHRVLRSPSGVVYVFTRRIGGNWMRVTSPNTQRQYSYAEEVIPSQVALQKQNEAVKKFLDKGFQLVGF